MLEPIEKTDVPEDQIDNSEVLKEKVNNDMEKKDMKKRNKNKKKRGKKAADELEYSLRRFSATVRVN